MKRILVNTKTKYNIDILSDIFSHLEQEIKEIYDGKNLYIITDNNVGSFYLEKIKNSLPSFNVEAVIVFPGEESKSFSVYEKVLNELIDLGISRGEMLIALGGGVVGDLTGFVASTLFRGLPFIQIPTSLIAMVDSSIGGKTAINLGTHKNIVGCFKQPSLVVIDPKFLQTLPLDELKSGYGEVIKHALIKDESLLLKLEKLESVNDIDANIIEANLMIKKYFVEADEFDNSLRMILNFGHTFGHIIELRQGLKHGEAVLSGMLAAIDLGNHLGIGKVGLRDRLLSLYKKLDLKYVDINWQELLPLVSFDKKNIKGMMNFILLEDIAKPLIYPVEVSSCK